MYILCEWHGYWRPFYRYECFYKIISPIQFSVLVALQSFNGGPTRCTSVNVILGCMVAVRMWADSERDVQKGMKDVKRYIKVVAVSEVIKLNVHQCRNVSKIYSLKKNCAKPSKPLDFRLFLLSSFSYDHKSR